MNTACMPYPPSFSMGVFDISEPGASSTSAANNAQTSSADVDEDPSSSQASGRDKTLAAEVAADDPVFSAAVTCVISYAAVLCKFLPPECFIAHQSYDFIHNAQYFYVLDGSVDRQHSSRRAAQANLRRNGSVVIADCREAQIVHLGNQLATDLIFIEWPECMGEINVPGTLDAPSTRYLAHVTVDRVVREAELLPGCHTTKMRDVELRRFSSGGPASASASFSSDAGAGSSLQPAAAARNSDQELSERALSVDSSRNLYSFSRCVLGRLLPPKRQFEWLPRDQVASSEQAPALLLASGSGSAPRAVSERLVSNEIVSGDLAMDLVDALMRRKFTQMQLAAGIQVHVTAPAGAGKTRLFIDLATQNVQRGISSLHTMFNRDASDAMNVRLKEKRDAEIRRGIKFVTPATTFARTTDALCYRDDRRDKGSPIDHKRIVARAVKDTIEAEFGPIGKKSRRKKGITTDYAGPDADARRQLRIQATATIARIANHGLEPASWCDFCETYVARVLADPAFPDTWAYSRMLGMRMARKNQGGPMFHATKPSLRKADALLLDEAQDSAVPELSEIASHAGKAFVCVGDPNQNINGYRYDDGCGECAPISDWNPAAACRLYRTYRFDTRLAHIVQAITGVPGIGTEQRELVAVNGQMQRAGKPIPGRAVFVFIDGRQKQWERDETGARFGEWDVDMVPPGTRSPNVWLFRTRRSIYEVIDMAVSKFGADVTQGKLWLPKRELDKLLALAKPREDGDGDSDQYDSDDDDEGGVPGNLARALAFAQRQKDAGVLERGSRIELSTAHAYKGLESDVVRVDPNLWAGRVIPELRYVAVTRMRLELQLVWYRDCYEAKKAQWEAERAASDWRNRVYGASPARTRPSPSRSSLASASQDPAPNPSLSQLLAAPAAPVVLFDSNSEGKKGDASGEAGDNDAGEGGAEGHEGDNDDDDEGADSDGNLRGFVTSDSDDIGDDEDYESDGSGLGPGADSASPPLRERRLKRRRSEERAAPAASSGAAADSSVASAASLSCAAAAAAASPQPPVAAAVVRPRANRVIESDSEPDSSTDSEAEQRSSQPRPLKRLRKATMPAPGPSASSSSASAAAAAGLGRVAGLPDADSDDDGPVMPARARGGSAPGAAAALAAAGPAATRSGRAELPTSNTDAGRKR